MVPHHSSGIAGLDHWPDRFQNLADHWSSIDEITKKDDLPLTMLVDAIALLIAQLAQQLVQFISMPMNVTDQIIA